MAKKLIIRPVVDDDVAEATDWYERAQTGLGLDFLDRVQEALERLARDPDMGIVVYKRMRRLSIRRFPYGIFYVPYTDRIEVVAIMHARRSPRAWKKRLP